MKTVLQNLWATRVFFFVRLVASILIGVVYLLVAAGVQYLFVSWFGESTFNYIVGGIMSLALGALFCHYIGRLVFMFVRGWHMGAIAMSKKIIKKHMSALDVGVVVFQKHLGSYALVYSASLLVSKFVTQGVEKLWKLLSDVPYLGTLAQLSDNIIVKRIATDLLDTGFDACIYYLVKYTKPGVSDDLEAIPDAMRRYLYALPSVMLASLTSFFLLYIVPRVIKWIAIVMLILSKGVVTGILLNVLMYPVFYLLEHTIFDPLDTIILVSAFAKKCNEEIPDDSPVKNIVDSILEGLGVDELGSSDGYPVRKAKDRIKQMVGAARSEDEQEPEFEEPAEEPEPPEEPTPPPSPPSPPMERPLKPAPPPLSSLRSVAPDVSDLPLDGDEEDEEDELMGGLRQAYARMQEATQSFAGGTGGFSSPSSLADVMARVGMDEVERETRMGGSHRLSGLTGVDPGALDDTEGDELPPLAGLGGDIDSRDVQGGKPPISILQAAGGTSAIDFAKSLEDDGENDSGGFGGGSIGVM